MSADRRKNEKSLKVLVIGGGVAGMEAALILAEKGHTVHLVEKKKQLGGSVRLGAKSKYKTEFNFVVEYLRNQLKKMKVKVELGREIDFNENSTDIEKAQYDNIIIATGSRPNIPLLLPKKSNYNILTAEEMLEGGKNIGSKVWVLGAGAVGIEVAESLCDLGKEVTVIEMNDKICADINPVNRAEVLERLGRITIQIKLNTKVLSMDRDGLMLSKNGKEEYIKVTDTVVVAMGAKSAPITPTTAGIPVHYVGDCREIGNAMDAIHDAFQLATSL